MFTIAYWVVVFRSDMTKDPAFLFYASDFLTGTMLMNNEQVGIYIRLLCVQHQHGGMIDAISFNSMVGDNAVIRTKFIETPEGFYNQRMMDEMIKRNKKSKNLSANAMVRWEKEKQKQCKSNAIASDLDMPTEDEDVNEDVKAIIKEKDFEKIWKLYPSGENKVGKSVAIKRFLKSVKTEKDLTDIETAVRNYAKSEKVKKGFVRRASAWFEEWKDWVDYKPKKKESRYYVR